MGLRVGLAPPLRKTWLFEMYCAQGPLLLKSEVFHRSDNSSIQRNLQEAIDRSAGDSNVALEAGLASAWWVD